MKGSPVLTRLISELTVDTTPKKSMVFHILGGPLGQYEQEGIIIVVLVHQHPELYQATVEERDVLLPQTLEGLELNPY